MFDRDDPHAFGDAPGAFDDRHHIRRHPAITVQGIRLRHPRIIVIVPRYGALGEFDVDATMLVPSEMASRFVCPRRGVLSRWTEVGPRHRDIVPDHNHG
jgi:hypothetical protein